MKAAPQQIPPKSTIGNQKSKMAHASLTQRHTSGIVAFFPVISMPTRYMRDATNINPTTVATPIPSESRICHSGGVLLKILTYIGLAWQEENTDDWNSRVER